MTRALLFLAAAGLALAAPLRADGLLLKSGQKVDGKIIGADDKAYTVEIPLGAGTGKVVYPRDSVKSVSLGRTDEQKRLLASNETRDIDALRGWWASEQAWLPVQGTDTGEVGVRLVKLLLAGGTKKGGAEAIGIIDIIQASDWDAGRKAGLDALRVSALLQSGDTEKAAALIESSASASGGDETAVATARVQERFVQAGKAVGQLDALEKEHPRWDLMPEQRDMRDRLIQEALDDYLYPVAFHAELAKLCAEGLLRAALLYDRTGRPAEARQAAEDLIAVYPEPDLVPKARELLSKLKKQEPSS